MNKTGAESITKALRSGDRQRLLNLLEEVYGVKPEGGYGTGWEARAKGVVGEDGCKVAKQLITCGFTPDKIASIFLWKVCHGLRLLKTFLGTEGDEELVRVLNAATPAWAAVFIRCLKCRKSLALVWWVETRWSIRYDMTAARRK